MKKTFRKITEKFAAFFKSTAGRVFLIAIVAALVLGICAGARELLGRKKNPMQPPVSEKGPVIALNKETAAAIDEGASEEEKQIIGKETQSESKELQPDKEGLPSGSKEDQSKNEKTQKSGEGIEIKIPQNRDEKPGSDAKTNPPEERLPETEAEKLASEIYKTADITEDEDGVVLSYSQPEIPGKFHLSVRAGIYNAAGGTLARYVSDAGWLTHPENYDASEKAVKEKLDVKDLNGKQYILQIRITETKDDDNAKSISTVYQLIQDSDGTRTLQTSVFSD